MEAATSLRLEEKLDGSDYHSQEYIPITDFFNTHGWEG
jgi:hypothetical protein